MKKTMFIALVGLLVAPLHLLALTSQQLENSIRTTTTGCPDFTIIPPSTGSLVVNASSFGFSPSNTGASNYTALVNAINYCSANKAYKLIVPTGTYKVGNYGTHYGNGTIYFNGFSDFIFDGQGSTFLMQSKSEFMDVDNCNRMMVQNLTVGWDWSLENPESLTQITNIGSNYMDVVFPYESNPSVTANVVDFVEVDSTNYNFLHQGLGVVSAVSQLSTNLTTKPGSAQNVIRYFSKSSGFFSNNGGAVGQFYIMRHYEYDDHGIHSVGNTNLLYTNVTVYSTLGMGFLFSDNQYYGLVDSKLIREPGSIYHLSGSADGIHVANSYGYFKIQNVEIGNTGDDSINIHDTDTMGVKVTGTYSLTTSNAVSWRNPYNVGDPVELRNPDLSPLSPPFTSTLTAVGSYGSDNTVSLTFANALPSGLSANTILFNHKYNSANYIVSGCYIHNNKVRGIVTYCANGTIENNQFIRNYCPGINILCEAALWQEGVNPSNIVVQGNLLDGNDILRKTFPHGPNNVEITAETTAYTTTPYPICRNILFQHNIVKNCPYAGIEIASATNVVVQNNLFENPNLMNDLSGINGCISIKDCGGVVFNNNELLVDWGVTSYKTNIYVDSTATNYIFTSPFVNWTLPTAWTWEDIGFVGLGGTDGYTNGTYTVNGSGSDIWSTSDTFQYVYQMWNGDGQIVARVPSMQNTSAWAKAGLMYRQTDDADAQNTIIFVSPASGVSMQGRTNTSGNSYTVNTTNGIAPPTWLSLVRLGSNLYGYTSPDGVSWSLVGVQTNVMTDPILVGLAVTSKSNSVLNTSTFDHVSVSGAWLNEDIGNPGVAGSSVINYSNGIYTVSGSGADIWSSSDSFQYLYQACAGDYAAVARVTHVDDSNPWAKAAIMIRASLASNAANTTIFLSPSNGVSLQGRTTMGGSSSTVNTISNLVAPRWIKLIRSGSNMNAYESGDGSSWTWVGTQTNSISSSYYIGLAVCSKSNTTLNTSTFDNVTVQNAWTNEDIGVVGVAGGALIDPSSGTFTISGAGGDIWANNDQFQFVEQPLYGNGQIVARVTSEDNTNPWCKAGVMIRDSLATNAINALLFITPTTNGVSFQGRTTTGGNASTFAGSTTPRIPYWLKLTRSGSSVSAYQSSDGVTWSQVGATQTITMSTNAWIGLVVCAKDNSVLNTSTFDNVTITPLP